MKKLLPLLLIILFASCKKDKSIKCYHCDFYDQTNSCIVTPSKEICTDELPSQFYDIYGNEVAFVCR